MNLFKITLILLTVFSITANAAHTEKDVKDFVDKNANEVITILEHSSLKDTNDKLTKLFLDVIDYDWMSKFAIGKNWLQLNDAQKQQYQEAYKNYLISIYVSKYADYNKDTYIITSTKILDNNQFLVSMNINVSTSSAPIKVDYRIKDLGNFFKVRDIVAENISLISTQRSDFTSFLSNNNIEGLIQNLKKKSEKQ